MPILVLVIAVVATVVIFEAIRRGALGDYAWAGYLVVALIWLFVLLNALGYGTGTTLRVGSLPAVTMLC
jgi:hypothetical protein